MVPLTTVPSAFHARVIAARIGSEGIVCELRGGVDGPYPMGDVHVLVPEDELGDARDLLLADDVESAFEDAGVAPPPSRVLTWVALAFVVLAVVASVARQFAV